MISIRRANNRDIEAICSLIFNIWQQEYGFDVSPDDTPDLLDIEANYPKESAGFLLAAYKGKVIGTIATQRLEKGYWVLKRMFVHSDHRGTGVAQRLMDELMAWLQQNSDKGDMLCLSTKESQAVRAKHFYLRNGFSMISKDTLPRTFPYFYEDDLFMQLELE